MKNLIRKTIITTLFILMLIPLFSVEDEESYKEKYDELKNSISETLESQQYLKSAPEGLESNNYVIDDKGYFWYIYEAVSGTYQIIRYNGYESEVMKIVNDNFFINDGRFSNSNFNNIQKASMLTDGRIVFLTPQNIILYKSSEFKIYQLLEKDRIREIFTQNDKYVVIGEKSYYVIEEEEVITTSTKIQLLASTLEESLNNYDFKDNKRGFLLTINNDILLSQTKYTYGYRYYKYNSNVNFMYMGQLSPIEQDYYVKLINGSLVDSIFVMNSIEYNELRNPMVEVKFISDTKDKAFLYFKYTNYFYSINTDLNKAERIDLSQDIKIVNIFKDKEKREWIIYHDDNKIYISEFGDFIKQDNSPHYYEFTEQESASGGSFCLYWNENIYKFITKGTLNNQKFTNSDKRMSEKDYEDQYKLEYIRYLSKDNLTDHKKLEEFNPGFEKVHFRNLYCSDNMLIEAQSNIEIGRIKEVKIYDLETGVKSKKQLASTYIRSIKYRRNQNLLILFSDESKFVQMESHLSKIQLSTKLNSSSIRHFENDILVIEKYGVPNVCKIYNYSDGDFTLRDTLLYNSYWGIDKVNNALILRESLDQRTQVNRYSLETGEVDSLLSFPDKTIAIVSQDVYEMFPYNILLVDEDNYKLVDLTTMQASVICEVSSHKLYPLIKEKDFSYSQIMDKKLFIHPSKILYDLIEDKYETNESWLTVSSPANFSYVFYQEEDEDSFIYRVSQFKNGNLIKQENDFIYVSDIEYEYFGLVSSVGGYIPIINKNLYNFNKEKWTSYSGVSDYYTFAVGNGTQVRIPLVIIKDTAKRLYVSTTNNSIVIIDYATGLEFSYNQNIGIPNFIGGIYLNKGELFVSGNSQLYKLNKSLLNPTLDISWLEVNGESKDLNKPLKFTSTENNITIPVAILNYMYPEEYPLKYKLTGFDKEWKVGTYDGKITYENLNPGKYTFDVQAFPTDFSDMSWPSIEFRILPPWYRAWWAYCSYVLFIALVIYLIFKQRVKQYKKNQEVLENKVAERTQELTEQQKKMRESIEYASLIQRSILPQPAELEKLFSDYFVIWKPRDIVGGDFYWLYENPDQQQAFLSVIDCTGHGVPGALLSMTVNSLLNHTIKDKGTTKPAKIIQELHQEICSLMHQKAERSIQDGFEIALIKFDFANNTLTYSGAGLNIVIKEPDKELFILKGDRYNVGGQKLYANINFTEESYTYVANTKIYLYSDGIVDQPIPGSERAKRLGYKGWIEKINSLQGLTMTQQSVELNTLIDSMLDEHEQRDDITIMGVEI